MTATSNLESEVTSVVPPPYTVSHLPPDKMKNNSCCDLTIRGSQHACLLHFQLEDRESQRSIAVSVSIRDDPAFLVSQNFPGFFVLASLLNMRNHLRRPCAHLSVHDWLWVGGMLGKPSAVKFIFQPVRVFLNIFYYYLFWISGTKNGQTTGKNV